MSYLSQKTTDIIRTIQNRMTDTSHTTKVLGRLIIASDLKLTELGAIK